MLGALVLAGLLLAATRPDWVVTALPRGAGSATSLRVRGADAAPLVPALGLVGVAGALALSVGRSVGRVLAGLLVAAAGAGAAAAAVVALARPAAAVRASVATATGLAGLPDQRASTTAWPLLACLPALALAGCGLLAVVRGRAWAVSGRFEAPAASGAAAGEGAVPGRPRRGGPAPRAVLWDELSRGGDPTAADAPAPAPASGGSAAPPAGTMGARAPDHHREERDEPAEHAPRPDH